MAFPVHTSAEDIKSIASYLKTKPTGEPLEKARSKVQQGLLDPRKLSAYRALKLVGDSDQLELTQIGRSIARNPNHQGTWFDILRGYEPYAEVLEWIYQQEFEEAPTSEVQAHIHSVIGGMKSKTLASAVNFFFSVGEAAGLGSTTIGRHGKETRFAVNRQQLRAFVEGTPLRTDEGEALDDHVDEHPAADEDQEAEQQDRGREAVTPTERQVDLGRVFIGHGKNETIRAAIKRAVALASMEPVIEVERETTAEPVSGKVFDSMRTCAAAVINVSLDEAETPEGCSPKINDNVLTEIGGALALFGERVILVWDTRLEIPTNLGGLFVTDYQGDDLGAEQTLDLIEALNQLRSKPLPAAS